MQSLFNSSEGHGTQFDLDWIALALDGLTGLLAFLALVVTTFLLNRTGWPVFNFAEPWIPPAVAIFFFAGAIRSESTLHHPLVKALWIHLGPFVLAGIVSPAAIILILC